MLVPTAIFRSLLELYSGTRLRSLHANIQQGFQLMTAFNNAASADQSLCLHLGDSHHVAQNIVSGYFWYLLCLREAQRGRFDDALSHIDRALALEPNHAGFQLDRGVLLQALGHSAAAENTFRLALSLTPHSPEALNNLANSLHELGQTASAVSAWRKALEIRPDFAEASQNLAIALTEQGGYEDALRVLSLAAKYQPTDPAIATARGHALVACGRYLDAADIYRALLASSAAFEDLRPRLSHALRLGGRIEESLNEALLALQLNRVDPDAHIQASAALSILGRGAEAEAHARQALHLRPDDPESCYMLAILLDGRRQRQDAIELFRKALRGKPNFNEATIALARTMSAQGLLDDAEDILRAALARTPQAACLLAALGDVLTNQGRLCDAQQAFRESLRIDGAQPVVESCLLFALVHDPRVSAYELRLAHDAWAERHAQVLPLSPGDNDSNEERVLRIGYVSADFCSHVVARFFGPVLRNHNRQRVHAICYADIQSPDEVTCQLRRHAMSWRLIRGRSDAEVAELVRADRIDILVDLAGHTGTRLGVFARQPAPLQVTWLGYPATAGLATIPFLLTDKWTAPSDPIPTGMEEVARLPTCFCCFEPNEAAPPVVRMPYYETGRLTFGSTHKLIKLNDSVLDAWSAIVRCVPNSRLLVYRDSLQGRAAESLEGRLLRRGLSPDQFECRHEMLGDHTAIYSKIDVLLDAWPWNGHATACEALWQGVPVLTLRGRTHASRMVASVIEQLEMPDFIADSSEEFVSKAISIAADAAKIADLRRNLRQRVRSSPLCDGRRFTAELEDMYKELWRRRALGWGVELARLS